MKLQLRRGLTSKLARIFIPDSSQTNGSGLTGLVYNSAGLVWYYIKEGDASPTAVTLQTMTVGTWVSGGFREISAANMPGFYEIGIPNAALSTGDSVVMMLRGAVNMAPVPIEIQIIDLDVSNANLVQIDGQATSGNNATLNLAQLNIVNSGGDALVARSIGSNGRGMNVEGHGTSPAANFSGASGLSISATASGGSGISSVGGSTNGYGLVIIGGGGGAYAECTGASGAGVLAQGPTAGLHVRGYNSAPGTLSQGGPSGGSGAVFEGRAGNAHGLETIKNGTGVDLKASDHGDGAWSHSLKRNTAVANYKFAMRSSTTGDLTPGLSITAERKLDAGGVWVAMPGTATIIDHGSGVYAIDIAAVDTDGLTGVWKFTAPGADPTVVTFITES